MHCVDALLAPGCYIVPTTGVSYDAPEFEDAPDTPTEESCVTRAVIAALGGCHVFTLDAKDLVANLGDAWMVSKKRRLLTRYTEELLPLYLQRVPFFKGIPTHDVSSAARRFTVVSFAAGTTIVAEGSRSDAFYVVVHGEYAVTVRGKRVFQGAIGDFFGEIGLLQDVPATASVIAKRDTLVMVQHRSAFHGMLEAIPSLSASIQSHVASRQASSVQKLKSDLFATMTESQLNRLTQRIKYTSVGGGTVIAEYGADSTVAYVVAQGTVSYAERPSGGPETVSLKASGAAAGTDALLPRASAQGRQTDFKLFTTDSAAVIVKLKRSDIEYTFAGDSAGLARFELYAHGTLPPLPAVLKVEEAREAFEGFVGAVLRLKRPVVSALADGLGFLALPHAIAQATGGKVLPVTAGTRDPTLDSVQKLSLADKREYLQKLPVTVSTKIVCEFVMACDDVAAMAFGASPDGQPIQSPPRGLLQLYASTISKFCGSAQSPGTAIGAILPPTEVARLTGLAATPPDTLKLSPFCMDASLAVVQAGLNMNELYQQFQATDGFKGVMSKLRTSTREGAEGEGGRARSSSNVGPPRGTTPRIPVGKMNRYGQWQPREVCVDMDKKQIGVYDEKGMHTHSYPLIDFARVERVSAEPEQLKLVFHESETKDYVLKFQNGNAREQFCLLLHLLEPDLIFSDSAEKYEPVSGRASFAVSLERGTVQRVLVVDRASRTLSRHADFETHQAEGEFPIEWERIRMESSLVDASKLKIVAYSPPAGGGAAAAAEGAVATRSVRAHIPPDFTVREEFEVNFPTHALRERFAGLMRLTLADVEVSAVRVLGLSEAGYTHEKVRMCAVTLNCADERAPALSDASKLKSFLPPQECELYIVGLQECKALDAWRACIVECLSLPGAVAFKPEPYEAVAAVSLQGIHTMVFARQSVLPHITNVHTDTEATGVGGIWGNKGATAMSFTWADSTHVAVVNCHLAAGHDKVAVRNSNFSEICQQLKLKSHDYPSMSVPGATARPPQFLHHWHHVIWLGNLNYRVDLGSAGTEKEYKKVEGYAQKGLLQPILKGDQLRLARESGAAYSTFLEAPIKFAPSYRLEKGGKEYINKRNQNPSYTDRVLWTSKPGYRDSLTCRRYRCDFKFDVADHRPVVALFEMKPSLGFLNLHSASRLRNHGSCNISIPYLRFDCLPLPPSEFAAGDAGLDVPSWSIKLEGAAAAAAEAKGGKGGRRKSLLVAGDGLEMLAEKVGSQTEGHTKGDEFNITLSGHFLTAAVPTGAVKHASAVAAAAAAGDRHAGLTMQGGARRQILGADTPGGTTPGVLAGTPYTVAEWRGGMIPDCVPVIAEPGYVASEHLLLTVRKKNGALVGHSELSLRDAYHMAMYPDKGYEDVSLHGVLDNPVMRKAFQAFCDRELSRENVDFYLAVAQWSENVLKSSCKLSISVEGVLAGREDEFVAQSAVRSHVDRIKKEAEDIYASYLDEKGDHMVNLPSRSFARLKKNIAEFRKLTAEEVWAHLMDTMKKTEEAAVVVLENGEVDMGDHVTSTVSRLAPFFVTAEKSKGKDAAAAASGAGGAAGGGSKASSRHKGGLLQHVLLFDEAREEIFKLMQRDTLSRFENTMRTQDRIRRELGNGAPFCLPVVRDGAVVGSLSGQVLMKVFDVNTERDKRIQDLERIMLKGKNVPGTLSAVTETGEGGASPSGGGASADAAAASATGAGVLTKAELLRHIDSVLFKTQGYETAGTVDPQEAKRDVVRLRGVLMSAQATLGS